MIILFYRLTNAKIEEILAKIQEKSYIAMFDCIKNIYNLITYKYLRILCANTELKTAYMHGTLFSF